MIQTNDIHIGAEPVFEDGYMTASGLRLHYVSAGRGDLILFLHGFPEFWYAWKNQLEEFGKDHRAVALDLPGCCVPIPCSRRRAAIWNSSVAPKQSRFCPQMISSS